MTYFIQINFIKNDLNKNVLNKIIFIILKYKNFLTFFIL